MEFHELLKIAEFPEDFLLSFHGLIERRVQFSLRRFRVFKNSLMHRHNGQLNPPTSIAFEAASCNKINGSRHRKVPGSRSPAKMRVFVKRTGGYCVVPPVSTPAPRGQTGTG